MGKANDEYAALFNSFTYWEYSNDIPAGATLKQILERALNSSKKNEFFCQVLEDAIRRHPELAEAKLLSPSWQQQNRYSSETYACVFELPNGDKYVAYRGTGDTGWIDNGKSVTQKSTLMQKEAAQYFDQVAEEQGWTESDNIYVTGHSKGGNKVQYVTLMAKHAELIDECHSWDGEGFSDEAIQMFKENYSEEEYQQILNKMYAHNGANDFVSPTLNTIISKEHTQYYKTSKKLSINPLAPLIQLHDANMFFQKNEKGEFVCELVEKTDERGLIGNGAESISDFLMSLPKEERDAAAMVFMQLMEVFNGGEYKGIDGATLTWDEIKTFYTKVLPKMVEEIEKSMGLDSENTVMKCANKIVIPLIGAFSALLAAALVDAAFIFQKLSEYLNSLGKRFNEARKKLESIIDWLKEKGNQLVEWFKKQRDSLDYSYFYIDSEKLLQIKGELEYKKTQLEEKADKIREIRKRVDFGNITQQQLYFYLVSSARNLENEAKAVNRLSKGIENCVNVYTRNEQNVVGIYGRI